MKQEQWVFGPLTLQLKDLGPWQLAQTIDSRVTGIGSSINTSFVILLFYIMPMVNHLG